MRKPKMVIFDAGRTLIDSVSVDTYKGVQALMPHITSNPRCLSAEQIDLCTNQIFAHFESAQKKMFEVRAQTIFKLVYDSLNLKFSLSMDEIERMIWLEDTIVEPVEQARELISELNKLGVRTAVISNLDFSGYLLQERLDTLFPENRFEFVIASSDYGVRKPASYLFEVGITKSGLSPEEIWYVGDKVQVDVTGSQKSGMIPVLYKNKHNVYDSIPEGILAVNEYSRLIQFLHHCED